MNAQETDLTFFTNDENQTLLDRFKATLADTHLFDVLVGYFHASGFYQLYDSIEPVEKTRILIGIGVDREVYRASTASGRQMELDFESHANTKKQFQEKLVQEVEQSLEPDEQLEVGLKEFIAFLQNDCPDVEVDRETGGNGKKLEIRAFPSRNIHAKVYIGRFAPEDRDYGFVITGSSNFSYSGLVANREFNVELRQRRDVAFALKQFEDLWLQSVDISQEFVDTVKNRTWLNDTITPQLVQQIKGRILVICPPGLKGYWEESLHDFRVPARVESLGKLEHVIGFGLDRFDYVVVDEAHRFRNEATQSYADLLDICRRKKVILVTATPLNNTIDDIFAQLKLFQAPKNSTIPGIPNLERFFQGLRQQFKGLDRTDPGYKATVKAVSGEIRERILKHIMVRRTRGDVLSWFKEDVESQGLFFPTLEKPRKIIYAFEGELEAVFNRTIGLLHTFRYARYIPLLYYVGSKPLSEFERQQQRNVGGFMKGILIKRLESSFFAFRQSISRFIRSYERFIAMFEQGTVYISKKVDVYELLDSDDLDTLENLVEAEKAQKYAAKDFCAGFIDDLRHDLEILRQVKDLWKEVHRDPKIEIFIEQLAADKTLKDRQLVIFTESRETGDYLFDHLNQRFPGAVLFFSSRGGRMESGSLSLAPARELVKAAFDPNHREPDKSLRLLISTDILSEGINLHRANILINYDLPWNPTRVLQRAGRINRLGTEHTGIFIYNFFPTTQADTHLGLKINITNKIQMFHDILGEDAKYLSDGEEIGSQELFDTLNSKKAYTGEEEEGDSELMYLELMRKLRDDDPSLFEKIKRLPKKTRSGRKVDDLASDQLVTFFRIGKLKKFYLNQGGASTEITFFDTVRLLECQVDTPRHAVPNEYHRRLAVNKQRFDQDTLQVEEPTGVRGGRSNLSYIDKRLKDKGFRNCRRFTDTDEELIDGIRRMIAQGTMAKKVAQTLKKEFEKTLDPLEMLAILRRYVRVVDDDVDRKSRKKHAWREVILSGYQIGGTKA